MITYGKVKVFFDKAGDVLDITIGKPKKAISEELDDDIVAHRDIKTKELVGFTILNFTKRFEKSKRPNEIDLPVSLRIAMAAA